ncbi:hypothetical protein AB0D59_01230 [Streptomyces sp. NPDC048417]|uniref:hypothetical protein n=1 Tax=Streptomyces sp. NPDC048417 TaxID=3155387 RepID=UPI0034213C6C
MRIRSTIAAVTIAAAALTACASSNPSSKPTPSYASDSVTARCRAEHWPQPMPDVRGKHFDPLDKDLQCFDNVKAIAPDGHDVMNDSADQTQSWTVTASKPATGVKVTTATPITLVLRAAD